MALHPFQWRRASRCCRARRSCRTTWSTISEVNRKRTVTDNLWAAFYDAGGQETEGSMLATAATYGADKLWVLLKPVPISMDEVEEEEEMPLAQRRAAQAPAAMSRGM